MNLKILILKTTQNRLHWTQMSSVNMGFIIEAFWVVWEFVFPDSQVFGEAFLDFFGVAADVLLDVYFSSGFVVVRRFHWTIRVLFLSSDFLLIFSVFSLASWLAVFFLRFMLSFFRLSLYPSLCFSVSFLPPSLFLPFLSSSFCLFCYCLLPLLSQVPPVPRPPPFTPLQQAVLRPK